jgi:magnesium and cobalt exporter, CNNM family
MSQVPPIFLGVAALVGSGAGHGDGRIGIFWQAALIILFVLLNGFFVAAEFALVKVRTSQLDEIIDEAKPRRRVRRAMLARQIIVNIDSFLSAAQLGITICSLVLGALAEPFVHRLVAPLLGEGGVGLNEWWVRGISWTVAIASVTSIHVVVGEQMPKTLAIRRPLDLSLWVGAPMKWFHWCFKPLIWLLNTASITLLRWIFKVEAAEEGHMVHSSEELRLLVEQSEEKSEVTETERDILVNALGLSERIVRDIMTPRSSVVPLDVNVDFQKNLRRAVESKHTRFPLIDRHFQNTLGLVHIKDLLAVLNEPEPDLRRIKRELLAVPNLMPLDKLLKFFLAKHTHLALVVDEFGGTVGMVTLDDVIEELVGTIHDEFDAEERPFQRLTDTEFLVDAGTSLHDLAEFTELKLESDDVSTVGGYVTKVLGHLPNLGEKAEIAGYEATVTRTNGHRLVQLHFRRLTETPAAPTPP